MRDLVIVCVTALTVLLLEAAAAFILTRILKVIKPHLRFQCDVCTAPISDTASRVRRQQGKTWFDAHEDCFTRWAVSGTPPPQGNFKGFHVTSRASA